MSSANIFWIVVGALFTVRVGFWLVQARAGDKLIEKAKIIGALWHWNSQGNSLALCRAIDLHQKQYLLSKEIREGALKPWEPKMLFVVPTYTFSKGMSILCPAQVGSEEGFDEICNILTEVATGVERSAWGGPFADAFKRARNIIVAKEIRLFVPFVSEKMRPFEWQEGTYGKGGGSLEDAKEDLLRGLEK